MKTVLALVLALGLAVPALSEEPRNPAIEETISSQMRAFQADDLTTAFNFAAPGLKRMFQTPERFATMVRKGYPMVWRPSRVEFLTLENFQGQLVQRVLIEDEQGGYFVAEYAMIETPDGWQIRAVRIQRAAEMSV